MKELESLFVFLQDGKIWNRTEFSLWHYNQLELPLAFTVIPKRSKVNKALIKLNEKMALLRCKDSEMWYADSMPENAVIGKDTQVSYVYQKYKICISLDATPSTLSNDASSGKIYFEDLANNVERLLLGVLRPMEFDIGEYCPKLYVSIVAHGIYPDPMRVLVQNVLLCKENVGWLVRKIKLRLEILENDWAEHANMDQSTFDTAHEKYGTQGVHLESCMHVLSLMPEDAAALIVLVSDGVAELPYTTSYDDVFMKLARRDIQCHVAMLGNGYRPNCSFGYVPDVQAMEYLAEVTNGTFLYTSDLSDLLQDGFSNNDHFPKWNVLQERFFYRHSAMSKHTGLSKIYRQKVEHDNAILGTPTMGPGQLVDENFPWVANVPQFPIFLWQESIHSYKLNVGIGHLVNIRLQEGFSVSKMVALDEIEFIFQWKPNIWLTYAVSPRSKCSDGLPSKKTIPQRGPNGSQGFFVDVTLIADIEFVRAYSSIKDEGEIIGITQLRKFVRDVRDVDCVLLHLLTAGNAGGASRVSVLGTNEPRKSQPVFEIIGDLSMSMWNRWFVVEQIELLSMMNAYPVDNRHSANIVPAPDYFKNRGAFALHVKPPTMYPVLKDKALESVGFALKRWATQQISKNLVVKYLQDPESAQPENEKGIAPDASAFCIARIQQNVQAIVCIYVAFFATPVALRQKTILELQLLLVSKSNIERTGFQSAFSKNHVIRSPPIVLCKRPLSPLLLTKQILNNGPKSSADFYQFRNTWEWNFADQALCNDVVQLIHKARQLDGFWVLNYSLNASGKVNHLLMGKEIVLKRCSTGNAKSPCLLQYGISLAPNALIKISFWMEPQEGLHLPDARGKAVRSIILQRPQKQILSSNKKVTTIGCKELQCAVMDTIGTTKQSHELAPSSDCNDLFKVQSKSTYESDEDLLSASLSFYTILKSAEAGEFQVPSTADSRQLAPSFSTARLIATSIRKSEALPMYLNDCAEMLLRKGDTRCIPCEASADNKHLYTMLEHTLRVLSDCEVPWTDFDGKEVISDDLLSTGKCFAKVVDPETILLAFLPCVSSSMLSVNTLTAKKLEPNSEDSSETKEVFSLRAFDDSALLTSRRLSFREGYKSWRMGGFHGSTDAKNTKEIFPPKLLNRAAYGKDVHFAQDVFRAEGGKFCVAYYECSKSYFLSHVRTSLDRSGKSEESRRVKFETPKAATLSSPLNVLRADPDQLLAVSKKFRKKVQRAHQDNFSRGVYLSLRDGRHIEKPDLQCALKTCVEIPVDLDITLLYQINKIISKGNEAEMDKRFSTTIAEFFAPIPGTEYYYYIGSEEEDFDEVFDDDYDLRLLHEEPSIEQVENLYTEHENSFEQMDDSRNVDSKESVVEERAEVEHEVAAVASTFSPPFFVRIECKHSDKVEKGNSKLFNRAYSCHHGIFKAFENLSQGSVSSVAENESILSAKAQSIAERVANASEAVTTSSCSRAVMRVISLTLPNEQVYDLSQHGGNFFQEKDDTESIRHQMLSCIPMLHRTILKTIRKRLKDFSTAEVLTLLLKCDYISSSILNLVQYLFTDIPELLHDFRIPLNFVSDNMTSGNTSSTAIAILRSELQRNANELCLESIDGYFVVNKRQEENGNALENWTIVEVFENYLQISLFVPGATRFSSKLQMLTSLQNGLRHVIRKVNQLILLSELHETRTCSSLLLSYDGKESDPEVEKGARCKHFWSGQFECALQFSTYIKIHERVSTQMAISALSGCLQHFVVHNRRLLFVYREGTGNICYIKLSLTEKSSPNRGVYLQVYGVLAPGPDVTTELCKVGKKGVDDCTLAHYSKLFARNLNFQMSTSDLVFFQSDPSKPDILKTFPIPDKISNAYTFLHLFRQCLCKRQYVNSLNLSSVTQGLVNNIKELQSYRGARLIDVGKYHPAYLQSSFGEKALNDATIISPVCYSNPGKTMILPIASDFFTFILNFTADLPIPLEILSKVGLGIVFITFDLISLKTKETLKSCYAEHLEEVNAPTLLPFINAGDNNDKLGLKIQAWTSGAIDCDSLVARIYECFQQSCIDYASELYLNNALKLQGAERKIALMKASSIIDEGHTLNGVSMFNSKFRTRIESFESKPMSETLLTMLQTMPKAIWPLTFDSGHVVENVHANRNNPDDARTSSGYNHSLISKFSLVCATTSDVCDIASGSKHGGITASRSSSMSSDNVYSMPKSSPTISSKSSTEYSYKNYPDVDLLIRSEVDHGYSPYQLKRTAYYCIDICATGFQLRGYNLHVDRIDDIKYLLGLLKTWCNIRQSMLHSILAQKSGLYCQAPVNMIANTLWKNDSESHERSIILCVEVLKYLSSTNKFPMLDRDLSGTKSSLEDYLMHASIEYFRNWRKLTAPNNGSARTLASSMDSTSIATQHMHPGVNVPRKDLKSTLGSRHSSRGEMDQAILMKTNSSKSTSAANALAIARARARGRAAPMLAVAVHGKSACNDHSTQQRRKQPEKGPTNIDTMNNSDESIETPLIVKDVSCFQPIERNSTLIDDPLACHGKQIIATWNEHKMQSAKKEMCESLVKPWMQDLDGPAIVKENAIRMLISSSQSILHRRMPLMMVEQGQVLAPQEQFDVRAYGTFALEFRNLLAYDAKFETLMDPAAVLNFHAKELEAELNGVTTGCSRRNSIEKPDVRIFRSLYLSYLASVGYILIKSEAPSSVQCLRRKAPQANGLVLLEIDFSESSVVGISLYFMLADEIYEPKLRFEEVEDVDMIAQDILWCQDSLNLYTWVYDYSVQECHLFLASACSCFANVKDSHSTRYPDIVLGLNSILHRCPVPPLDAYNSVSFVFIRIPHEDESTFIPTDILLRYIACRGDRYKIHDLFHHGSKHAIACNAKTGFTNHLSKEMSRRLAPYSFVITLSEVAEKCHAFKVYIVKSVPINPSKPKASIRTIGDDAIDKAQIEDIAKEFVSQLFCDAKVHYRRDSLWARVLHRMPESDTAEHKLAFPVGVQELEDCLQLSYCIPLSRVDPSLQALLDTSIPWEEFIWRLSDVFENQIFEYHFGDTFHALLLCPNARDLIIHVSFLVKENQISVDVCRREATSTSSFHYEQRVAIGHFVNCLCHWHWRHLIFEY